MSTVYELLISAAIVGLVIAALERADFPGWPEAIGSAFGIGLCAAVARWLLPEGLALLSYVAGAIGGGFLLAWLCELPLRRGFLAAAVYLIVRVVLSFLIDLIT